MAQISVLVTGAGAPCGVSIMKALRAASLPIRIVAVDAEPLAQGLYRADSAHLVPSARPNPDAYIEALVQIAWRESVQILFSGWEGELPFLAARKEEFEQRSGALLPLDPAGTLIALDKYLTVRALQAAGVGAPDSVLPSDAPALAAFRERHRYPYLLKPRNGSGGRGLVPIRSDEELAWFSGYTPDPVLQEMLPGEEREYTVGLFLRENGRPDGALALRRSLAGGLSYRMESDLNEEACAAAERAACAIGLVGPVNVQLRLTPGGPKVFEINPRCSSSTCVRAEFGLNEPERAIRRFVLGQELPPVQVRPGVCLRFWEELFLPAEAVEAGRTGLFAESGHVPGRFSLPLASSRR